MNFKDYLTNFIGKKFIYLSFGKFGLYLLVCFLNILHTIVSTLILNFDTLYLIFVTQFISKCLPSQ